MLLFSIYSKWYFFFAEGKELKVFNIFSVAYSLLTIQKQYCIVWMNCARKMRMAYLFYFTSRKSFQVYLLVLHYELLSDLYVFVWNFH